MVFLQLLICLLPGHFSLVFQQPHNDLILLIAMLILICYVFSCAPAWIVFSGDVSSYALWAVPRLCLSFRSSNSLILPQCFSATCLSPSFIPAPCAKQQQKLFFFWVSLDYSYFQCCLVAVSQSLGFQWHFCGVVSPDTLSWSLWLTLVPLENLRGRIIPLLHTEPMSACTKINSRNWEHTLLTDGTESTLLWPILLSWDSASPPEALVWFPWQ